MRLAERFVEILTEDQISRLMTGLEDCSSIDGPRRQEMARSIRSSAPSLIGRSLIDDREVTKEDISYVVYSVSLFDEGWKDWLHVDGSSWS